MLKSELFLNAMAKGVYRRKAWVIAAFSLVSEAPEAWKTDAYAYRLVSTPTGYWYVDPSNLTVLLPVEDGMNAREPLFTFHAAIDLKARSVPNLNKATLSTYGNVLVNYALLVYPFGDKIPYMEGKIKIPDIESIIVKRLKDNPNPGEGEDPHAIYVKEYLRFTDAAFYLPGFMQLCVPAATRKTMTRDPEIPKLRARLLEENKDRLHDPAVIAKIDAELVKHDQEVWMKDDPGADFLLSSKAYSVVRKKLFLMQGAEVTGLDERVDVDLIQGSLSEGWDIAKFPQLNNSLRAGSFNRGALTMLGGEAVKWLLRASSNMAITKDDCGSTVGFPEVVNHDKHNWIGFSIVTKTGHEVMTEENHGAYLGKMVMKRSPMFCILPKTDFCTVCAGPRLAALPTALSAAVAETGSAFLSLFLAAAHGKALQLAHYDFKEHLG